MVYVCGLSVGHGYISMADFILIVLFQIIYFSISTTFSLQTDKCQSSSFSVNTVLHKKSLNVKQFYLIPRLGLYQVLPLQAWVDLDPKAMNGYSAFPKEPALLNPH